MNVIDRILARITVDENGCHIFGGALDRGYGRVGLGGRDGGTGYTHRLMYAAANGPIPEGLHIDHLCRNRACCNPEHLEAVPQGENNRRAAKVNYPGIRGIYYLPNLSRANPWRAEIYVEGKRKHVGLFPSREEAEVASVAAREVAQLQDGAA